MSRWATVLQHHLEELVRLNERLLTAARSRQEAMAARDTQRLEILLAEERRVMKAVAEEEQRRQVTMIRLGGELGLRPEQMARTTVAEVARRIGGPVGARLVELRGQLQEVARQTAALNQTMTMLARRLLPFFDELLEILLTGAAGRRGYSAGGRTVRARRGGLNVLDMRV
jgi:hypothetical protein